jgi:nitrite reductase/ring-hydroxylating ferredoxin subunit
VTRTVALCRIEELPDGDSRGFDPMGTGQDTVIVIRQRNRVYAYKDACPHYGTSPMAWRKDAYLNADRTRIVCSAHGAQFDITTGACTLGPCLGQSLIAVPTTINDAGELLLAADWNECSPTKSGLEQA